MLENKLTVGSKLESVPYTAETLAAADYNIQMRELTYNFDFAEYKRKYLNGKLSPSKSVIGKQGAGCNFVVDLTEGTAAVIPHAVTKLLQACGCREIPHFAEAGDNNNQLSTYTDIDGIVYGTNTSASGILYVSIVDDTGGFFHVNFYRDSSRTLLVAHTATYNTTGRKALIADNTSGLSGFITVTAVTAADVDITATLVGVSWMPNSFYTTKPITLEVVEMDEGLTPVQLVTKFGGMMGNCKIVLNTVGDPLRLEFEFRGKLISITDRTFANMINFVAANEGNTSRVLSATITHNAIEQQLDKLTLDFGNEIQMKVLASDPTGYAGAYISARESKITCDPYTRTIAGEPDYMDWKNMTAGVFQMLLSMYTLSAPVAQKVGLGPNVRNGSRIYDKTFLCAGSSGDDEWRLLSGSLT